MNYRVVWMKTTVSEEQIEANSIDEAKEKWERLGCDGELFFIEDEEGDQVVYD